MGRINLGRVLLAGIVAGIVSDILGYLVDGVWLASRWSDDLAALGKPDFTNNQVIWFNVLGIVSGIVLIWIYAAIRPRLGAGFGTALIAGFVVWVIGSLIPNLGFMWIGHLFTRHLAALTTAGALVETLVGAVAGAALYKEG